SPEFVSDATNAAPARMACTDWRFRPDRARRAGRRAPSGRDVRREPAGAVRPADAGVTLPAMSPASPEELQEVLRQHSYLADRGLAVSIFLAMRMGRPLLLEGEPGVGKTEVARTLAEVTGAELIRLQCYEGIDAAQ